MNLESQSRERERQIIGRRNDKRASGRIGKAAQELCSPLSLDLPAAAAHTGLCEAKCKR